jgi:hypothetical protein
LRGGERSARPRHGVVGIYDDVEKAMMATEISVRLQEIYLYLCKVEGRRKVERKEMVIKVVSKMVKGGWWLARGERIRRGRVMPDVRGTSHKVGRLSRFFLEHSNSEVVRLRYLRQSSIVK